MLSQSISLEEMSFIKDAAEFLENPTLLIKLAKLIGQPIEFLQKKIPFGVRKQLVSGIEHSIKAALYMALRSINTIESQEGDLNIKKTNSIRVSRFHTAMTATTGALGGFFGMASLPIELPISTTIILRSISGIAREWGHDLKNPTIQLECLYIFTLGSPSSKKDDEMDSAYLGSRLVFEKLIYDFSQYLSHHSALELIRFLETNSSPMLLRLMAKIGTSYEVAISKKLLAKGIPILGAVGGAAINSAFCDFFNTAAHFHFGLRYLENKYGHDKIQNYYQSSVVV